MKFLVDECTGLSVVTCLRDEGHDVVAVVDIMPKASDKDILSYALSKNRIVVTNVKDFGRLVYRSEKAHCGVVLLRLSDERAKNKMRIMKSVLTQVGEKLQNHYVVATEIGIRVRK